MQFSDLNLKDAPKNGVVLAYTREKIVLDKYDSIAEVQNLLGAAEILEIHLFDKEREYRAVRSVSKRWFTNDDKKEGIIETTVIGSDKDDTYVVDTVLDTAYRSKLEGGRLKIVNLISYNDDGAAMIDNYRLTEGGM